MSNKIVYNGSLQFQGAPENLKIGPVNKSLTQSGSGSGYVPQTIGTSWEALTFTDLSAPFYLFIYNDDATNFVQLALANDNSGKISKLLPKGIPTTILTETATLYAKADTSSCVVKFIAIKL